MVRKVRIVLFLFCSTSCRQYKKHGPSYIIRICKAQNNNNGHSHMFFHTHESVDRRSVGHCCHHHHHYRHHCRHRYHHCLCQTATTIATSVPTTATVTRHYIRTTKTGYTAVPLVVRTSVKRVAAWRILGLRALTSQASTVIDAFTWTDMGSCQCAQARCLRSL